MRALHKLMLSGVKVRPGRRWPRRLASVLDDRLLGADWTWEDDEDEPTTRVRPAPAELYLA